MYCIIDLAFDDEEVEFIIEWLRMAACAFTYQVGDAEAELDVTQTRRTLRS
jgi:hypothetical protein